jgi:dTMP kinase
MVHGVFITLEGGEGTGKSTHIALLKDRLKTLGYPVLCTREPGGTVQAEAIRDLLVTGDPDGWSPLAEALLMNAARESHLRKVIRPALESGSIVISDRFMDSTRAYQGSAGGVAPQVIDLLEQWVVGKTIPDLTIVFDLDAASGLSRSRGREGGERFERKGLAFHQAVRERFLAIARSEPQRCVIVDSAADPPAVAREVWKAVEKVLPKR